MCLLIVNNRLQPLITPPADAYLPDARVPARGEVAVRLSWEARVFVHHCFDRFNRSWFEFGNRRKSEEQLQEVRDGESEVRRHNQSPHGVMLSNRKLC